MDDFKLAHLEHLSQQLIHQVKTVNTLIARSWYELELLRQDLRALSKAYDEWLAEKGLDDELPYLKFRFR
jgi:hypothetical protein